MYLNLYLSAALSTGGITTNTEISNIDDVFYFILKVRANLSSTILSSLSNGCLVLLKVYQHDATETD